MRASPFRPVLWGVAFIGCLVSAVPSWAQPFDPWATSPAGGIGDGPLVTVAAEFSKATESQPAGLFVTATVEPGWHIYSMTQPEGGPTKTTIKLQLSAAVQQAGEWQVSPPPHLGTEPDAFDDLPIESHEGSVTWFLPLKLPLDDAELAGLRIEGEFEGLACRESCLPVGPLRFVAMLGQGVSLDSFSKIGADSSGEATKQSAPLPPAPPIGAGKLAGILILSFLGGLILNLMPCVLPVISLKLLAFVEQGGQSRARIFSLNLWFSAGLLFVFLVLATLSTFLGLGWGEQFTFTEFKVSLTALIFVMALAFLGVWEIPIPGFVGSGKAGALQTKEGAMGAFFKGVLTTILATPCIGPFLGPMFGFMLHQPALVVYLVFGAAGLGMASPYILIGAFPRLIRFLPKPGLWMETLKEVMGFFLLGTVVYLLSAISERFVIPTLSLLVGLWFACWLIGRTPITASGGKRAAAWLGGIAMAAMVGLLAFTVLLHEPVIAWKDFSPAALAEARSQGKTVMVDVTADWCPNCKTNLAWAIDTEEVNALVEKNQVEPLLADWTDHSPMVKEYLHSLHRQAIPVLAIYPAGAADEDVIILDGTIWKSQVLEALDKAGPSQPADSTP